MFERTLHDVLTEALALLASRKDLLDAFVALFPFYQPANEDFTVEEVILQFAAQDDPVITAYPSTETDLPVWTIVLAGEQEGEIGLSGEESDDDDDGNPTYGSVFNSTFQVLIYSKHPDVTVYLYYLVRALLISLRLELVKRDDSVLGITALSGTDLNQDEVYNPANLFVRSATLTVKQEVRGVPSLGPILDPDNQTLPVKRVGGVHVLDPGKPKDRVTHGVTVFGSTAEDDE